MLGMGSVAVRELLGLPAPAHHGLSVNILNIYGVHDLGALHLDGAVNPGWWRAYDAAELLLDHGPHHRGLGQSLEGKVGEATDCGSEGNKSHPVAHSQAQPSYDGVWDGQVGQIVGEGLLHNVADNLHSD